MATARAAAVAPAAAAGVTASGAGCGGAASEPSPRSNGTAGTPDLLLPQNDRDAPRSSGALLKVLIQLPWSHRNVSEQWRSYFGIVSSLII